MKWIDMSEEQRFWTLKTMSQRGGGFVGSLADAWMRADSGNSRRLALAFPDFIQKYGPKSDWFVQPKEEV